VRKLYLHKLYNSNRRIFDTILFLPSSPLNSFILPEKLYSFLFTKQDMSHSFVPFHLQIFQCTITRGRINSFCVSMLPDIVGLLGDKNIKLIMSLNGYINSD
jgi:hypothetical protein